MVNFLLFIILSFTLITACSVSNETKNGTPSAGGNNRPELQQVRPGQSNGTIHGGGGAGIRCDGKLEMLDVFLSREQGIEPMEAPSSKLEALNLVADRMALHEWNPDTIPIEEMTRHLRNSFRSMIELDGNDSMLSLIESLPLSEDLGELNIPENCQLEQIAYFSDVQSKLWVVPDKFRELDPLSLMYLIAHEFYYLINRFSSLDYLTQASPARVHFAFKTRTFVAKLLSRNGTTPRHDGFPRNRKEVAESTMIYCRNAEPETTNSSDGSPNNKVYFYGLETQHGLRVSFNTIHGMRDFGPMQVNFPDLTSQSVITTEQDFEYAQHLELDGGAVRDLFRVLLKKIDNTLYFQFFFKNEVGEENSFNEIVIDCEKF